MDGNAKDQRSRIDVLDGLRGLAITMVLLLHFWEISWLENKVSLPGLTLNFDFLATTGAIGVNLFFFISGFCLFWARTKGLADYAWRRAIKIVPSYVLAIAVICVLFDTGLRGGGEYGWHLATHALFIHNWWRDTASSINGVFWSLGVEVQFYLLFPWLARVFRRWPLPVTAAAVAGSTLYRLAVVRLVPEGFEFWLNQLPGFLDFFLLGMLAAHCVQRLDLDGERKLRIRGPATVVAPLAMAGLLGLLWWAHQVRYVPGIPSWQARYRPLLGIDFLVLTVASVYAASAWKKLLGNPVLVYLSTISYNLYIWHQFIGRQLVAHRIPDFIGTDPHLNEPWKIRFWLVALPLSLFVSTVVTYAFERPLLRVRLPIPSQGNIYPLFRSRRRR